MNHPRPRCVRTSLSPSTSKGQALRDHALFAGSTLSNLPARCLAMKRKRLAGDIQDACGVSPTSESQPGSESAHGRLPLRSASHEAESSHERGQTKQGVDTSCRTQRRQRKDGAKISRNREKTRAPNVKPALEPHTKKTHTVRKCTPTEARGTVVCDIPSVDDHSLKETSAKESTSATCQGTGAAELSPRAVADSGERREDNEDAQEAADKSRWDDDVLFESDSSSDTEENESSGSTASSTPEPRPRPRPRGASSAASDGDDGAYSKDRGEESEPAVRFPLSGGVSLDPSAMDVALVKQRIEEIVNALVTFSQNRKRQLKVNGEQKGACRGKTVVEDEEPGTVTRRRQLMTQLAADIVTYYQYGPELTEYLLQLFKPEEACAFLDANEEPRPITLRTNTLKTRRRDLAAALIARGCNVDPLGGWTQVGLKVYDSTVPVGATPEYLAGHYMLQSAASLIPVLALAPQPGERILDLAAAPGGKATYIAQLLKNKGVLFANDAKRDRCTALAANLHRLGVTNCVVSCLDGRKIARVLPPVDRVLLDAPCSGSGIISRDPSIKVRRTPADFAEHSKLQKQLLCAAVDAVNAQSATGGYVVYSTCSVAVEENEEVLDYILRVRHVKLVPFDVEIGAPGLNAFRGRHFHPTVAARTRRFYPHLNNFDGFFVAKLKKLSNEKPQRIPKDRRRHNRYVKAWDKDKWVPEYTEDVLDIPKSKPPSSDDKTANPHKPRQVTPVHNKIFVGGCKRLKTKNKEGDNTGKRMRRSQK